MKVIMKNKLRQITVNDEKYFWSVLPNTDDGGNILKIWKNKVLIFDKWLTINEITPKIIKTILTKNKIVINNIELFWNHIPNGIEDIIQFWKNDKKLCKFTIIDCLAEITNEIIKEDLLNNKEFLKILSIVKEN